MQLTTETSLEEWEQARLRYSLCLQLQQASAIAGKIVRLKTDRLYIISEILRQYNIVIKGGIFYGGYAFYVIRGISYIYSA